MAVSVPVEWPRATLRRDRVARWRAVVDRIEDSVPCVYAHAAIPHVEEAGEKRFGLWLVEGMRQSL